GQLQTHPNGPLTVNGAVTATPTAPNSSYSDFDYVQEGACKGITVALPTGKALVVTSITVEVNFVTTGPVVAELHQEKTNPCDGAVVDRVTIGGTKQTTVMSFAAGVPIQNGHKLSLLLQSDSADSFAWVTVHGYFVASTSCTVFWPPVGC